MQLLLGTWKSLVKGPKDTRLQWMSYVSIYTVSCVCPVCPVQGTQELTG